jgi:phage terminase large subunit
MEIQTARIFEPLLKPSRYKGVWGGRGSGKSHYMAGAVVEYCLLHPGARIVCIREVQKTLAQMTAVRVCHRHGLSR